MEPNRSESSPNQPHNVHLHMHHVCNCPNVYSGYFPAVGYRTQLQPMVSYPPPVPRHYLQHYQYTQFNVGNQYTLPIAHMTTGTPIYGSAATGNGDVIFGAPIKDRRDRSGSQEGNSDGERNNEPFSNSIYDLGQVTPPDSELLLNETTDIATPENFVKFLEKSCLTAEQIAHRNRNKPCFRNIQNLCIRTRSEILKPCTTIANIHSQGIPWATKDFIYAFVRLTNCWHILKGYWENRDGSSLGKIEKELTPEFRACYVRWEKETIELAAQLTRVFYNLDTNLMSPQSTAPKPPMPTEIPLRKPQSMSENVSTSTLTGVSVPNASKNVRGILHLPTSPAATETVDQGNQTYAGDFCATGKEEGFDSEEERRVYMKPGSYCVPKKEGNGSSGGTTASPRAIEFLETAQNINKAQATNNDRYWAGLGTTALGKKGNEDMKVEQDVTTDSEFDLNLSTHLNVHEWLLTSNFSDFGGEPSSAPSSAVPHDLPRPPFFEAQTVYNMGVCDNPPRQTMVSGIESSTKTVPLSSGSVITLLQRSKPSVNGNGNPLNGHAIPDIKRFPKPMPKMKTCMYEVGSNGLTDSGLILMQNLLIELKKYDILDGLDNIDKDVYQPATDIDTIMMKLKNEEYIFVNEVVRDLKYLIEYYNSFAESFKNVDNKKKELVTFIAGMFSLELRTFLQETFPEYDFSDIKGDITQSVGPMKFCKFSSIEDQFV